MDPGFAGRCLENKAKGIQNIIVAGVSYGQGSSREHAAMCPMYLGVKAVIAKSFERIHAANLINFGILPLVFENAADYDRIEKGDRLTAENWREDLTGRADHLSHQRTAPAKRSSAPAALRKAARHSRRGRPAQLHHREKRAGRDREPPERSKERTYGQD